MTDLLPLLPFEVTDGPVAADLLARVFPDPWSAASLEELLNSSNVGGLKILQDNALVGFVLYRVVADEAEILTLVVHPVIQGKGLGGHLLGGAMVQAIAGGAEEIFLEVATGNQAALGLYQAFGFEEVARRERYYGATGEDAVIMKCRLSPPPD